MHSLAANYVLFFVFFFFSTIDCQPLKKFLLGVQAAQTKHGQSYVNWQFYEKVCFSGQWEKSRIDRQKYINELLGQVEKTEADERKRVADQKRLKKEHIALVDTLKSYMDAPWYFSWTIYLPAIWWYTMRCRAKQKEQRI